MWMLKGKTDSTGGKFSMYINTTNGKGRIKYYVPNGIEYGNGNAQCFRENNTH